MNNQLKYLFRNTKLVEEQDERVMKISSSIHRQSRSNDHIRHGHTYISNISILKAELFDNLRHMSLILSGLGKWFITAISNYLCIYLTNIIENNKTAKISTSFFFLNIISTHFRICNMFITLYLLNNFIIHARPCKTKQKAGRTQKKAVIWPTDNSWRNGQKKISY